MRLADFIKKNAALIIKDWQDFARTCPTAPDLTSHEVRDDIGGMLKYLIADLEKTSPLDPHPPGEECEAARRHAEQRFTKGFDTVEMAAEFRALRANIMKRWLEELGQVSPEVAEIVRMNQSIDLMAEESLERYMEKEKRARSLFLGTLIHDIRNPLNAVVQSAQLLEELGSPDPKKKKLIAQIQRSAARIGGLTSQLIDLVRLRLGKPLPVSVEGMDFVSSVKQVVDEALAAYPDREIHFTAPPALMGEWDRGRISQVASNLVGNALQHGNNDSPISVSVSDGSDEAVLSVHNFGDPISKENLPMIFDPLARGLGKDEEDSDKMSMGLGLFITKQIANAHGGKVDVASDAEQGTTFTVRLPRHQVRH